MTRITCTVPSVGEEAPSLLLLQPVETVVSSAPPRSPDTGAEDDTQAVDDEPKACIAVLPKAGGGSSSTKKKRARRFKRKTNHVNSANASNFVAASSGSTTTWKPSSNSGAAKCNVANEPPPPTAARTTITTIPTNSTSASHKTVNSHQSNKNIHTQDSNLQDRVYKVPESLLNKVLDLLSHDPDARRTKEACALLSGVKTGQRNSLTSNPTGKKAKLSPTKAPKGSKRNATTVAAAMIPGIHNNNSSSLNGGISRTNTTGAYCTTSDLPFKQVVQQGGDFPHLSPLADATSHLYRQLTSSVSPTTTTTTTANFPYGQPDHCGGTAALNDLAIYVHGSTLNAKAAAVAAVVHCNDPEISSYYPPPPTSPPHPAHSQPQQLLDQSASSLLMLMNQHHQHHHHHHPLTHFSASQQTNQRFATPPSSASNGDRSMSPVTVEKGFQIQNLIRNEMRAATTESDLKRSILKAQLYGLTEEVEQGNAKLTKVISDKQDTTTSSGDQR